jgi:hypothetical protein
MGKGFKSVVFDRGELPEGMRKTGAEFDRAVMRMLKRRGARRDDAFLILHAGTAAKWWLVLRRAAYRSEGGKRKGSQGRRGSLAAKYGGAVGRI